MLPPNRLKDHPSTDDWELKRHLPMLAFLGFTGLGIGLCVLLAMPFLPALAWALALAVLFTPLQQWFETKLTHSGISAMMAVLVIALIVVVPGIFMGQKMVMQAVKGAQLIEAKVNSGEWRRVMQDQPRLAPLAIKMEQEMDLAGTVKSMSAWLSSTAGFIVTGSVFQVVNFFLVFYLLFFFLRDRHTALRAIHQLSPLSIIETERISARISGTIHATVYGTLAVSAIQGLLGGLMFWWLGLPAALLWGVMMAILAVIPFMGAFIVWIPAVVFLALEGSWGKALILSLWGLLIVGTIDNLLRPALVGRQLNLLTVLVFISVVGGLMLYGPAGLLLGPVTLTLTRELLETWQRRSPPPSTAPTVFSEPSRAEDLPPKSALERWENEGGEILPMIDPSPDLLETAVAS